MPQSLAKVWLHTIFSTRARRRVFLLDHMRDSTCAYMTGIFGSLDCPVARIGLPPDHVHILHQLSRTRTIADVVGTVKRRTTEWLAEQEWTRGNLDFHEFHWQRGYGTFSVSESVVPDVKGYIERQVEHHRRLTFQEEYRALLVKHGMELDERVLVDKIIEFPRAINKARRAVGIVVFLASNVFILDQVYDRFGERLAVQGEVLLVFQEQGKRVGDLSRPQVQGGPVFDQTGDQPGNFLCFFINFLDKGTT